MNTMKALPASALALIALLMLSLFTSCAGDSTPQVPAPETSLIKDAGYVAPDLAPDTLPAETLATEPAETTETAASPTAVSAEGIYVMNTTTCTGIDSHSPTGASSEFALAVGRVYLHTQIGMPASSSGTIQHVWKHNGKAISTVDLTVKGPSFRTWSYKTLSDKMAGNWTVDVLTGSGELLETVTFAVN